MVRIADLNISQSQFQAREVIERTSPLAQVAEVTRGVGTLVREKEERDAAAFNVDATTEAQMAGAELLERATNEAESPEEISNRFFELYEQKRNDIIERAPNQIAVKSFDERFASLRSEFGQRAIGRQIEETQSQRTDAVNNSITALVDHTRNTGDFDTSSQTILQIMSDSASFLSPSQEREFAADAANQLRSAQLDYMFEQGQIKEVASMINDPSVNKDLSTSEVDAYRNAIKKFKAEESSMAAVTDAISGKGSALDPKDADSKQAVDNIFRQRVMGNVFSDDPVAQEIGYMGLLSIVSTTGIVPESMQSFVRSAYVSENPEAKALAYRFVNDVNIRNPNVVESSGLTESQVSEAVLFDTLRRDGFGIQEAVSITRESVNPTDSELNKVRKEALKGDAKLGSVDIADFMDESFLPFTEPDILELEGAGLFGNSSSEREMAYAATFNRLYETSYMKTGNKEAAKREAEINFRRNHGLSRVTTDDEYVSDFPPEQFYSNDIFVDDASGEDNNHLWMRDQLQQEINSVLNRKVDMDNVRVIPDFITRQDVDRGLPPTYQIFVEDEELGFQPVGRMQWDTAKAVSERKDLISSQRKGLNRTLPDWYKALITGRLPDANNI